MQPVNEVRSGATPRRRQLACGQIPRRRQLACGRNPRRRQTQAVGPRVADSSLAERRPREGTPTKRGNADQESQK